ncbi:llagellar M-ring protein FliF [Paracoccus aminophilus JCM 7686]|uniref:Flagellar M-ring protein n=2 Tax=Paracoccus aminophilus TaxID=34003 RepID=S5YQ90_PARAH|nr:llagellar M-ring protein FliF [Paracoccus aminophilus JCM 7686]
MAGAFIATFLGVIAFAWYAARPSMALLYSGLEPQQSGVIISAIEKEGVPYEIRGDSIWVAETRRDELRMQLAGQGLPQTGGSGYELLDGMSGFGTTSQMFDAAYWRAKEGELARTILALPNVKTARVHLAVPGGRGYRREAPPSASVTITTTGTPISPVQARALRYLISAGVPGMASEQVAVIDSARGIIASADDMASENRESEMKRNVERILEAHVGPGNAIVELHLDLVTETELLSEQKFDPASRALLSQENEESSDQNTNSGSGAVTAASNLPEGQNSGNQQNKSARSETRQRSNYEVSKLTREIRKQPGDIRRLSVAVLVNGTTGAPAAADGTPAQRSDAELETIRELVSSAVGLDENRGDQLTVKSLPFAGFGDEGTTATNSLMAGLDLNTLAKIALVGIFALALALLVFRPILRAKLAGTPAPALDTSLPPPDAMPMNSFDTVSFDNDDMASISISTPEFDFVPMDATPQDPVSRLKELMKARQEESLKVLSGWIEKPEDAI